MMPQSETLTYRHATCLHLFELAGRTIKIAAPKDPDALLDDPESEKRYATDQSLPYWPVIWPSGLMLAEQILVSSESPVARGTCRILELGCGLGLGGIAAGLVGGSVTFTDYDGDALRFAEYNARLNGVADFSVKAMDWRKPDSELFNWIIASDVLYERRLHELLINVFDQMLLPGGEVWMTDPQRSAAADFPLLAASRGYRCSSMTVQWEAASTPPIAGTILKLSRVNANQASPLGRA